MDVNQMPPGYTVVDTNVARGPRPTSPDVIKQFKTVINLEVGWFDFFHGELQQERDWCAGLEVNYVHHPMSDLCRPSKTELCEILAQIQLAKANGPTLVHCLHGEDRTGMVCAAYRILMQNWRPFVAIDEMYKFGFHQWAYAWWTPVLRSLK